MRDMSTLLKSLGSEHCFIRIDIDDPAAIDLFLARPEPKTALLFKNATSHQSLWDQAFFESLVAKHIAIAKKLASLGVKKVSLAADDDGILHKIISPRFSSMDLSHRMKPLLDIYVGIKDLFGEVSVWLTVEELAPGGTDATDGVRVAKELEILGLEHIVASAGTRDFPPLFYRRATAEKNTSLAFNEPALASAIWLKKHTGLRVSSVAFIDDEAVAKQLGQELGLFSVIAKT